jgi:hypothetical protein
VPPWWKTQRLQASPVSEFLWATEGRRERERGGEKEGGRERGEGGKEKRRDGGREGGKEELDAI